MSCNLITDVSGIWFCDGPIGVTGTYIGPGTSFDIDTTNSNQVLKIKAPDALVQAGDGQITLSEDVSGAFIDISSGRIDISGDKVTIFPCLSLPGHRNHGVQ